MKKTFLPLVLAITALVPHAYAQDVQPIDGIAAIVDEDVILQSELERAVRNITLQYGDRAGQLPPEAVLRRQVLERLILVQLQTARAEATGVRVGQEEIDSAVATIARQNNMTPDQLRQQLASEGMSFAEFRASLGDELAIQRLRQRFAQSTIVVTDAEIEAALSSQQAGGVQYRLANILVALPNGATPEQIATGQEKIDGIHALLERGEMDFAAAAVRYSDAPNALEGGDLGWRTTDEIPSAFSGVVGSLQPGQVLGPVRGPSGFQLLQMVETRHTTANPAQNVTQYQARHILVRGDDAAARARIDALRARVGDGEDFAAVARDASDDTVSRETGGDLGWFVHEAFGPQFGNQVAALQDGEVSEPFQSQAGWHIIQRTGSRQADVGDENRRNQARETIGQRKLEDEWNRFLREMRSEAFVDIRPAAGVAGVTDGS